MSKTCHNCGRETIFENIVFCPHCGKRLIDEENDCAKSERLSIVNDIEIPPPDRSMPPLASASSENSETKNICPVCCTIVDENDEAIICPDCKIKYHKDCWIDNNGCATYGCPSSGCLAPPPSQIGLDECIEALQDNSENITTQSTESIVCPYCQTKLSGNTKFCWNCGKDLPENETAPKDSDQTVNLSSVQTPASPSCSFGKKVLAGAACAGYLLIVSLIYYAIYGDSMNKANSSSSTPYWVSFLIVSGCSGIWKSITGVK